MCLVTRQICPLRARKDIVCYKFFRFPPDWGPWMLTFYRGCSVRIPSKNHPTIMDDSDRVVNKYKENGYNTQIWGGMIHAYRTSQPNDAYVRTSLCYKCIIPKGTLYYVGANNDICAKKLLVIEKCN